MFWLLFDPFTFIALMLAYIVSFIVVIIVAAAVAPKVAQKLSNRFSLHGSMALAALAILIGSASAVAIIAVLLAQVLDVTITLSLLFIIVIIYLIFNGLMYILSPFMINLMYGARRDPELQEIVNQVASESGMKPPKAVVVKGPPNAFAYGNLISGRYVAVSDSMLSLVNKDELKAVIGHEIGHHKHRDNSIMLIFGLIPSVLYFFGLMLIRLGVIYSFARSYYSSRRENRGGGGLLFVIAGILAVVFSFIISILVLAFSRLREYYADSHGAKIAGARSMQRSLAKIHLYYSSYSEGREWINRSNLKTLFIYAFTNAVANPLINMNYPYDWGRRSIRRIEEHDIDAYIERIKKMEEPVAKEIFSTHPPIPKRLRFLDKIAPQTTTFTLEI